MTASRHSITLGPVAALLTLAAITLAGCSATDSGEPRRAAEENVVVPNSGTPSDSSASASPRSFESAQHGYELELPDGWEFVDGAGTWTSFDQLVPGTEVPGEDLATSAARPGWLVANSMLLPKGMTTKEWPAGLDELVGTGPSLNCREQRSTDLVAGEQATVIRHLCDDLTIVGSSLVHADRGYYFTIGYPTDDASTKATLEEIVSSLHFTA